MSMTVAQFEQLQVALSFPIYVFRKSETGHYCDKIECKDVSKRVFERTRYLIVGGQCTCLSWMKTKNCKHLRMLRGDFDWLTSEVPGEYAETEAKRLVESLCEIYPEVSELWGTADSVPSLVKCLTLNIPNGPKGVSCLFCIKKFADGQRLGVFIDFSCKKPPNRV